MHIDLTDQQALGIRHAIRCYQVCLRELDGYQPVHLGPYDLDKYADEWDALERVVHRIDFHFNQPQGNAEKTDADDA